MRSPQFPRGKEPPVASLLQTLGPLSGDGLPAGGAGHSRPRSHGRSEQSPGVANSGRGQLCSGAEAVISGLENSCPEQAPQACPFSGAVIFPRGPSWPLLALCPLPTPFPSKVHGLCRAPHRETKMGGGVAGRRPHQRSIPGQRQPGGTVPEPSAAPSRSHARAMTWSSVKKAGNEGENRGWGLASLSGSNLP